MGLKSLVEDADLFLGIRTMAISCHLAGSLAIGIVIEVPDCFIYIMFSISYILSLGSIYVMNIQCSRGIWEVLIWCLVTGVVDRHEGGLMQLIRTRFHDTIRKFFSDHQSVSSESRFKPLVKEHIATLMFVGNFIGIVCARSLHYQFYSWYFFSLPFLLWKTPFPTPLRLILFLGVELCWNIYPSNTFSSLLLLCIHLSILWGLWIAPSEYPYTDPKSIQRKKE